MKLKKVEIIGFKSFADKTVIEFHEGITCVVGPNGCGKSNIGDAIRWVLGEQSAKAMRGGKMPDVIFAGASSKKALNFAEVTITFDEVQGALPLDYEEVAVTRRLHRSGESEYFINKQLVRLKDVQSLFLDSGIGKNNISFFEQGKIDQLIQYSPEERRYIFEEAAGIVRFLQRKRETFRKLEEVGLNLSRVGDIKNEIEKQIGVLESQAKEASIYREKKDNLELFEKEILQLRYKNYAKKKSDLVSKEEEAKEKFHTLSDKKELINDALMEKKGAYEKLEKETLIAREDLFSKQNEKDLKEQSQKHSEDRIKDLAAKEEKVAGEAEGLQGKIAAWGSEIITLGAEKEKLTGDLGRSKEACVLADNEFQALEKQMHTLRKKQTEAYREKVAAFQTQASLQNEVKQLAYRMETNLSKKEQLEERSQSLLQVIQDKEQEVSLKQEAEKRLESALNEAKENCHQSEERLKKGSSELKAVQVSLDVLMKSFHEKSAKLKALLHLRQEFAGFSKGGKRLLQEVQDQASPIFGLLQGLYECIALEKGQELALKSYAQTLVVKTKQDLDRILVFAKEHKLSDFSVICLESVENLESHLLGDVILDPDGWFIDAKGVLFVPGASDSSVFLRETEISELEEALMRLLEQKEETETEWNGLQKVEQDLKSARMEAEQNLRKVELAKMDARYAVQRALADLERTLKEKTQVDEEVRGLLGYVERVILEKEKAHSAFESANLGLDKIQGELAIVEEELSSKNGLSALKKQALQKAESERQAIDAEYRKTAHQFHLLEAKLEETKRLSLRLQEELESSKVSKQQWQGQSEYTTKDLFIISETLSQVRKRAESLELLQKESKAEIAGFEKQIKELETAVKEVENKLHQVGIQLAHVETGQNALTQEMEERFHVSIEGELTTDLSQEKLEKEIQSLKAYLDQNQNVNLAAIDECSKQKERAHFLNEQVSDLSAAKEELLKMIAGLDQECRTLFKSTFEEIRRNFQKNFQILFKGGEADLELMGSEDILESGIEITAKPPGKQMRSLSLLSGGEKCLTAMALLFAIFEVKSSPFCVLDEIDAPLDDSNVERFLNVVKQFIDRCQFIIVTHNKRTMALADRLYGVSMEEKGISKILFMEFSGKSSPQTIGSVKCV